MVAITCPEVPCASGGGAGSGMFGHGELAQEVGWRSGDMSHGGRVRTRAGLPTAPWVSSAVHA
jgi:hypothetical protein